MRQTIRNAAAGASLLALLAACGDNGAQAEADAPAADAAAETPAGETDAAADAEMQDDTAAAEGAEAATPAEVAGAAAIDLAVDALPAERTLAESRAFLAANAERDEVTLTTSGLQYEVLEFGPSGAPSPTLRDWVCVDFTGSLPDGTVFDTTEGLAPLPLPLSGIIDGWREALPLMGEGETWRLFVPPALGYGAQGAQDADGQVVIPPNSALIYDITLHRVMRPQDIAVMPDQTVNPEWNCAMPAPNETDAASDPQ